MKFAFEKDFENPDFIDGSPLTLPSLLLGGVLNGDASTFSATESGARDCPVASEERDLDGIFGFPARLIGGGTGGAEATGRSPLRGSAAGAAGELDGKKSFESAPGVGLRLGIL